MLFSVSPLQLRSWANPIQYNSNNNRENIQTTKSNRESTNFNSIEEKKVQLDSSFLFEMKWKWSEIFLFVLSDKNNNGLPFACVVLYYEVVNWGMDYLLHVCLVNSLSVSSCLCVYALYTDDMLLRLITNVIINIKW